MRAVDISSIEVGQKLAKTIYDDAGRVLLHSGTPIKDYYLERLESMGIGVIYIMDDLIGSLEAEDILHDTVRIQAINTVKNTFEKVRTTNEIDMRAVGSVIDRILEDIADSDMLVNFVSFSSEKMHEFNHSVSVAVLSVMTGMTMHLNEFQIKQLGMGAILHDIGKSVSENIDHCTAGFELIRQNKEINISIAHAAYQHHECYDGSGYPRGINGREIHKLASIVAVANHYDNLVSPLEPSLRLEPFKAVEVLNAESGRMFNPEAVDHFIRNIAPYPIGTLTRLSSGELAVVIGLHRNMPTRPVMKTVSDASGNLMKNSKTIDLLHATDVFIDDVIDEARRRELGI